VSFRHLTATARAYGDELERIVGLLRDHDTLLQASRSRARTLARFLEPEITAEQDRQRRSRR
jgi:hypothetical protein